MCSTAWPPWDRNDGDGRAGKAHGAGRGDGCDDGCDDGHRRLRHEWPCQPATSGPGAGIGGYSLNAVFSNALNLPMNAKVKLAGADVGQLESMVARNYTALTRLRIRDGVQLPRGSTAELRTATPLGDVFVALKPRRAITTRPC